MARFVRIGNNVVHIPSLANVSIDTTCFGKPTLCFYFHNQTQKQVSGIWKTYEDCERDLIRVKSAMMEVEKALIAVPLTEEPKVQVQVQTQVQEEPPRVEDKAAAVATGPTPTI